MHDPLTVAFEIRSPFRGKPTPMWPKGYRSSLVTIWHKDPWRGCEDSCGWAWPRLTDEQTERLKNAAWCESQNPYFLDRAEKEHFGSRVEAEAKFRALILFVAQMLDVPCTFEFAAKRAALRMHQADCINPANIFCFLPGHHTNRNEDSQPDRQEHFAQVLCGIARTELLGPRRPWWCHPRWHFWHWRIQVHPFQRLWHWIFDRCDKCGGRFRQGEARFGLGWDSDQVAHQSCMGVTIGNSQEPS